MDITYKRFRSLKRGDVVGGKTVVFVEHKRGGGAGMGEYPEESIVVMDDATVWSYSDPGFYSKDYKQPRKVSK